MGPVKLFVYGTLLRGERAHHLLAGARFVAEVQTQAAFELVEMDGGYPALVAGGGTAVSGEIYEIDERLVPLLDDFEDVPELYRRSLRTVGGHECWVYELPSRHATGRPRIASGDWRRR